jgi:adenosylhomocysteine nucleosidase
MDASPLFPKFEIPLYGQTIFPADGALSALLLDACHEALRGAVPESTATIHRGLIASGDRFVSGAVEARSLLQSLEVHGHTFFAVEMEGAAVAQVCADYGVPFAAVRTISDRADDTAHVDFPKFVKDVASVYVLKIVNALAKSL